MINSIVRLTTRPISLHAPRTTWKTTDNCMGGPRLDGFQSNRANPTYGHRLIPTLRQMDNQTTRSPHKGRGFGFPEQHRQLLKKQKPMDSMKTELWPVLLRCFVMERKRRGWSPTDLEKTIDEMVFLIALANFIPCMRPSTTADSHAMSHSFLLCR